jgi:hypothetical protein
MTLLVSCDNSNYQNGYDNGYKQGKVDGNSEGFKDGQTDGYNKGYNDGMQLKNKDISLTDAKFKLFDEYSFKIFTIIFYVILILFLGYALIASTFLNSSSDKKIFGKVIFLIVGLGVSFLTFKFFNIANLIFFQTDKSWALILVNSLCFIGAMALAWLIGNFLQDKNDANDVFIIIFSTFLLFHLLFLLTNIETFLLNNSFFATCIISTALGGLIHTAYRIVFQPDKPEQTDGLNKSDRTRLEELRKR